MALIPLPNFKPGRWQGVSRRNPGADDPEIKYLLAPFYPGLERRGKPRVATPFPATVRGVNASGEAFETTTQLNDLSGGGLNLRLSQPVKQGAKLFIIIWLGSAPSRDAETPRVAVRARVVRIEPESSGAYGAAVTVNNYRFL
jgi:c-di-GMP-binding flagellar brake protein YcgR